MRGALRSSVVVAALCAIAACQLIAGLEDRRLRDEAGAADAADATPMDDPCSVVGLPPRPDPSSSTPDDAVTIVYALQAIDFGFDAGMTGPYGFNLDKTCTCPGPDTCTRAPDAGIACDVPPQGIDNNGNLLFRKAAELNLVTQLQLNQALSTGESGVLVRIEKYNGQPNDAQVRVAVFSSLGIQGFAEGGAPKHDGTDQWTVESQSVLGGTSDGGFVAVYADPTAYVTNNTVVAALDFPVTIGSTVTSPVTIELTSGFIVAKLANVSGVRALSGTFAGRWPMTKMLTSFQAFVDPFNPPTHLCGSDPAYQIVKGLACGAADITRSPDLDKGGPCDAVGVGVHIQAIESQFGKVASRPDAGFPCGPQWSDSCQ
jgi:hypothetical protein